MVPGEHPEIFEGFSHYNWRVQYDSVEIDPVHEWGGRYGLKNWFQGAGW